MVAYDEKTDPKRAENQTNFLQAVGVVKMLNESEVDYLESLETERRTLKKTISKLKREINMCNAEYERLTEELKRYEGNDDNISKYTPTIEMELSYENTLSDTGTTDSYSTSDSVLETTPSTNTLSTPQIQSEDEFRNFSSSSDF
ncbi:hypothetical protein AB6A40_004223 [Gnathostoma spinigerum]|uniref:Uncharacterized protein n=1 Tax=Gnathostoma spinigerum TaxID=75299 RepID=A0ABD6EH87_9BILA